MWGGGKHPAEEFLEMLKEKGLLNRVTWVMYLNILNSPNPGQKAREYFTYLSQMTLAHKLMPTPFPLPPPSIGGQICIGNSFNKHSAGFNLRELNVLIAGEPDAGKTILENFIIALQAIRLGAKCWFFVKASDVEKLLLFFPDIIVPDIGEGILRINPLQAPPNVRRQEWLPKFWDIFIQSESLYDGTFNFLTTHSNKLFSMYEKTGFIPGLHDLLEYVNELKFPRNSRDDFFHQSAINRIGGVLDTSLGKMFDCSFGCLEKLVDKNVIFNIDSLPLTKQELFSNYLTSWLFTYKKHNHFTERHFLIIDDGMLLFNANFDKRQDRGTSIVNMHLAEVRKAWINMVVSVQFPSLVGQGIYGTSSTKILLACEDGKDTARFLDSMGVHNPKYRDYGMKLKKEERTMIVRKGYGYTEPFSALMLNVKKMDEIERYQITPEMKRAACDKKEIVECIKDRFSYGQLIALEEGIEVSSEPGREEVKEVKILLEDIYSRPFISSVARADYFHFNNEKAKKLYGYIESEKLADPVHLNISKRGGQTKFYWLTEKGCKVLGKEKKAEGSGGKGVVHIFVQYFFADFLIKQGFSDVEIEKYIEGKKIDLFCSKEGKTFAIEICISTANTEFLNVIKDRNKCDKIVIVCLDSKSKAKVTEELRGLKEEAEVLTIAELLNIYAA